MNFYTALLRPLLFRLDPERAHEFAIAALALTPPPVLRMAFGAPPRLTARELWGLRFGNAVGLAAGMDKAAAALPAWEALGFGFAEVGTITARAQPGNPKPRVFRYPREKALINRMGFNNPGAAAVAVRLGRLRAAGRWPKIPVGINIGKSKATPLDEAPADYAESARALASYADYFAVNVSSPNTPGLRDLQEADAVRRIAAAVGREAPGVPVLLKLAPDLAPEAAEALAGVAEECGYSGLIATNTCLARPGAFSKTDEAGGLSGCPLEPLATDILAELAGATRLPLVGSGGVMDSHSACRKFQAGASLVQIYTGFVYSGPGLIRDIAATVSA